MFKFVMLYRRCGVPLWSVELSLKVTQQELRDTKYRNDNTIISSYRVQERDSVPRGGEENAFVR